MREHCPACGRFLSGSYPVWNCKKHGMITAMLTAEQLTGRREPPFMRGQLALPMEEE